MERHASDDLIKWYERPGRKPLVLRGARQVGKSTLVRQFAAQQGLDLLEVNLEKRPLKSLEKEGFQIETLLQEIEVLCNKQIHHKSLIFIDEIQAQEKMLRALRYFYEDYPNLAVMAAGSLLDFALQESEHGPVGRVEYYYLGPMMFTEYLEACGEDLLLSYLRAPEKKSLEAMHAKLVTRYREFLYVGGMPEAIATYVATKSPLEVRRVQESIIATYRDDFSKYSKNSQINRVQRVFDFVPGHLGQKIKYSEIDRDERSRDLKVALNLLIKARIFLPVYHTNSKSLPLRSFRDPDIFKLYFLDVGLVSAQQGLSWSDIIEASSSENSLKGPMSEQFVAQHLFYQNKGSMEPELFYWLRDKKKQNAEVDFIIQVDNQIVPIEIKSEVAGRIRSLLVFMDETKWPVAGKLSLEDLSSEFVERRLKDSIHPVVFELRTIPLYLIESVYDLLR